MKELTPEYINDYIQKTRNIAIIAHVDHGKTTLMDGLISSCGIELNNQRFMDNQALE